MGEKNGELQNDVIIQIHLKMRCVIKGLHCRQYCICFYAMKNENLHRLLSFNLTISLPFTTIFVLFSQWLSMLQIVSAQIRLVGSENIMELEQSDQFL